jgi:hypothetical protein
MSYNVYGAFAAQAQIERLERAKQAAKLLEDIKKHFPKPTLFSSLPKKFHNGDKWCCRTSGVFSAAVP